MNIVKKIMPSKGARVRAPLAVTGPHAERIEAALESVAFEGNEPVFDVPLILLAFVNRSGSNLLGEYLQSVEGLGGFGEMLNWTAVEKVSKAKGIRTFPDYIRHLVESRGGAAGFGVKASGAQMAMLLRWNILAMFPSVKVIHIQRQDVVAQAVSLHFATETGAWMSRLETDDPVQVTYDFETLKRRMESVFESNKKIELVCAATGLERYTIIYEQMTERTTETIRHALDFLGVSGSDWEAPNRTRMQKQERPEKDEMVRRFREDLGGAVLG